MQFMAHATAHTRLCILILILAISQSAWAQFDPASSILVKPKPELANEPNLDSGRYTVKQTPVNRSTKAEKEPNKLEEIKSKIKDKVEEAKVQKPTVSEGDTRSGQQLPSSVLPAEQKTTPDENKNIIEALRDSILGGDADAIGRYRDQLHPEDSRQNIMNITIAPSYLYLDSSSPYWYRNYHSSGPGLALSTDIWLTPFVGITGRYMTSLAAEIDNDPATERTALVDHRSTDAGLLFRKYSSLSKKSPWFTFGIKFTEYQMIVPKADTNRTRIKSKGAALELETHLPTSNTSSWYFGTQISPKLKISEEATSINIKSGDSPTSYAVHFMFGQEFSFDRHSSMFWQISHRVEKTIYDGAANTADPITGIAPSGVHVTSGMSLFEIGYTWGD